MSPKTLESCHKGREFINYSIDHGADIRNGKGSHFIISTKKGMCVVPNHTGDLGKGLRSKIIKTLALILTLAGVLAFAFGG